MNPLLTLWGAAALWLVVVMAVAWGVQRATGQGGWADAFWSFGLGLAGVGVALIPTVAKPAYYEYENMELTWG